MDRFDSSAMTVWLLARNHLLDFAQLLLAEKHLLADKESGRAERATLDRDWVFSISLALTSASCARANSLAASRRRRERLERHLGISIFFGSPHMG